MDEDRRKQFIDDLESAFNENQNTSFNNILFDRLREAAEDICLPKFYSSSSADLNDSELVFTQLYTELFAELEKFIFKKQITPDDVDILKTAEDKLRNTNVKTMCAYIMRENETVYSCKDCAIDDTCVFCKTCFFNSVHRSHNFKMHASSGGCCDCGDPEAWTSHPWCSIHQGDEDFVEDSKEQSEIQIRMKEIRKKINYLPKEVIMRISRILKPLLQTVTFTCFELCQTKECKFDQTLSTAMSEPMEVDDSSTNECSDPEYDLKIIEANRSLLHETWPPPVSHIPHSQTSLDALSLDIDSFPRSAPKFRTADVLTARCMNQLELARKYHPRIFPPPTREQMSNFKNNYCVMLYNNEFHNYDQVIKTLKRVLHKSVQDATGYVLMVNNDGRSVISTDLSLKGASSKAASIMSTSKSISSKPLNATATHWNIVMIENLCVHIIQWISHLSERVPSIRTIICNALFGRFVDENYNLSSNEEIIYIEHPEQLALPNCFVEYVLLYYTNLWKILRTETCHILMGLVTKEPFFRLSLSILYVKKYDTIFQGFVYDDHKENDSLITLDCQMFTVISLAQILLEDCNVLAKFINILHRAVKLNSIKLPNSTDAPDAELTADSAENINQNIDPTSSMNSVTLYARLKEALKTTVKPLIRYRVLKNIVHSLNSDIWKKIDDEADGIIPANVFNWVHESPINRTHFNPFERILASVRDIDYVLGSILNCRPLNGDVGTEESGGWWNEKSTNNFLEYFRAFVDILCHFQDMKSFQRAVRLHVEHEIQWMDDYFLLMTIIDVIGLTCQACTTDNDLFDIALKHVQTVFYNRVGIYDMRFRVSDIEANCQALRNVEMKDLLTDGAQSSTSQEITQEEKIYVNELMGFQAFGISTEVFAYDVGRYRFSMMQPIPRLLAFLNGLALEMGKDVDLLKLKDEEFANLLLERPLQVFCFIAQCHANLWIRNGIGIINYLSTMTCHQVKSETIDRDLQLIQQIAAFLPPDQIHFRFIHKFNLINYLLQKDSEPMAGRISAMVMYLRIVLSLITDRYRLSVGYYDPSRVKRNRERLNLITDTDNAEPLIPREIEEKNPVLMDDLIHYLSVKNISYSELIVSLPNRSGNSILKKDRVDGKTNIQKSLTSRRAHRQIVEEELQVILPHVTNNHKINGKQVFSLKPEIAMCRFNRFYYQNRSSEQVSAEDTVKNQMGKFFSSTKANANEEKQKLINKYPILPPAPFPIFSFNSEFTNIINLVRCQTFIRILRNSLKIGIDYPNQSNWWNQDISDILMHIIQTALYEDQVEADKSGRYPFLEACEKVSFESESEDELDRLVKSRFWTENISYTGPPPEPKQDWKDNSIVTALLKLLEENSDNLLIEWTISLWKSIAYQRLNLDMEVESEDKSNDVNATKASDEKEDRMKEKRTEIFNQMMNLQRQAVTNFMHYMDYDDEEEEDVESTNLIKASDSLNDPLDANLVKALGPNRVIHGQLMTDNTATSHIETSVCNLCLEESPLTFDKVNGKTLLLNAYICRSNALSVCNETKSAYWDENGDSFNDNKTILKNNLKGLLEKASIQATCAMMCPNEYGFAYIPWSLQEINLNHSLTSKYLSRLKSFQNSMIDDPRRMFEKGRISIAGKSSVQSLFTSQMLFRDGLTESEAYWYKKLDSEYKHLQMKEGDSEFPLTDSLNYIAELQAIGACNKTSHGKLMNIIGVWKSNDHYYDPDKPLPLVKSRLPSSIEPYPVLAICPHAMHSKCKENYGVQQKNHTAEMNRRRNNLSSFEFRCPLCKAISLIDLPMFGSLPMIEEANSRVWFNRSFNRENISLTEFITTLRDWTIKSHTDNHLSIHDINNSQTIFGFADFLTDYSVLFNELNDMTDDKADKSEDVKLKEERLQEIRQGLLSIIKMINKRLEYTLHNNQKTKSYFDFIASRQQSSENEEVSVKIQQVRNFLPQNAHSLFTLQSSRPNFSVSESLWIMVQKISSSMRPYSLYEILHRPLIRRNPAYELRPVPDQNLSTVSENVSLRSTSTPDIDETDRNSESDDWKYRVPKLSESFGIPPSFKDALTDFFATMGNLEKKLTNLEQHLDKCQSKSQLSKASNVTQKPSDTSQAGENEKAHEGEETDGSESDDTINNIVSASEVRLVLDIVMKRSLTLISSVQSDWRALRQCIANTLITWEKNVRQSNWHGNFFNDQISEYNVTCLRYLLKATLISHAKYAPVSRGCKDSTKCDDKMCWAIRRDDPHNWWWWSLVSPFEYIIEMDKESKKSQDSKLNPLNKPNEKVNNSDAFECHQPMNSSAAFVFESVNRIAASEDAMHLWSLLVPVPGHRENKDSKLFIMRVMNSCLDFIGSPIGVSQVGEDIIPGLPNPNHLPPLFSGDDGVFVFSLIVDVDITSLFINLLHLRPGLETYTYDSCSCKENDFCCDNGRLRVPIGDYYETNLTRICYLAVLIQSILSWEPKKKAFVAPFTQAENDSAKSNGWYSSQLLKLWKRLRALSGLPDEIPSELDEKLLIESLSIYVRTRIIPFLRTATFIINIITEVNVPSHLSEPLNTKSPEDYKELGLMLNYLNLPKSTEDLRVVLSEKEFSQEDLTKSDSNIDLDDSFTLLKTITSWCLQVRNCLSRCLNHALNRRYNLLPEGETAIGYKPEACQPEEYEKALTNNKVALIHPIDTSPDINVPKLINLPREYSDILALASEYSCFSSGQNNSDPCICLICGHIACLTCYGCKVYEKIPKSAESCHYHLVDREFSINSIQAHIRTHHAGYGIVLKIYSCRVIMLSDQARRITNLPEIYKDSFGEPDVELKRGNVLYLVDKEYENLNRIWLSHQKIHLSPSEIHTLFLEVI